MSRDRQIAWLDAAAAASLAGAALATHAHLLGLVALGWAALATRQFRLARRAQNSTPHDPPSPGTDTT